MKNIKLIIAYDGTDFFGWQSTRSGPSIEKALKEVITSILQENISLQAASRTDRGVHAEAQVVNFFTKKERIDLDKFTKSLNALLPKSIRIIETIEMGLSFHPTLDAVGKLYSYEVCYGNYQFPHYRHYSWHVPYLLDLNAMKKAGGLLSGSLDFSSFCNQRKNLNYVDKTREVYKIDISHIAPYRLQFLISGNRFLYKMARNLIGTLIYVGSGKINITEISLILASKSRSLAGVTAPSHGLSLKKIFYPQE